MVKKKVCKSTVYVFNNCSMCCMTEGVELGEEFTLAGWHVVSDAAREELDEMIAKDMYAVHPILAYNVFGKIIKPKDYQKILAGATVEVRFRLTHYTISKHGDDGRPIRNDTIATFVADVERIWVVSTPHAISSPSKRKILAEDPLMSPSSKRGKKRAF